MCFRLFDVSGMKREKTEENNKFLPLYAEILREYWSTVGGIWLASFISFTSPLVLSTLNIPSSFPA
jgi:hypothetical protein